MTQDRIADLRAFARRFRGLSLTKAHEVLDGIERLGATLKEIKEAAYVPYTDPASEGAEAEALRRVQDLIEAHAALENE